VVNLPGPADWMGRMVRVRIQRAGPHSVWGTVPLDKASVGA